MPPSQSKAFPGFKHVCLVGLENTAIGRQVTAGIVKYRGQTHKWLIHHVGLNNENLGRIEAGDLECDLFIGMVFSQDLGARLKRLGKPVLDMLGVVKEPSWRTHGLDCRAIGRMAAEHFLEKGHRHFAYSCHGLGPWEQATWEGFLEVLEPGAKTLALMNRHSQRIHYHRPERRDEVQEKLYHWFPKMPRPFALLTHADEAAAVMAELAFFSGVSIPEDLAIMGWGNDVEACNLAHPHLSSISVPGERLGFLVAEHAQAILEQKALPDLVELPPINVVARRSTELAAVDDPIVAKALAIMRREAANRVPIAEIIRKLPVSKRSFNDRFLKVIGRTPREELFRIRLEMAKDQLLKTNQTVLHVAMDCGFADTESMVRLFKEATGLTPTQFRRQNRV